jgi:hypothetical protein
MRSISEVGGKTYRRERSSEVEEQDDCCEFETRSLGTTRVPEQSVECSGLQKSFYLELPFEFLKTCARLYQS